MKTELIPLKYSYWRLITAIERLGGKRHRLARYVGLFAIGGSLGGVVGSWVLGLWGIPIFVLYFAYMILSEWTDLDYEETKKMLTNLTSTGDGGKQ